MDRDIETPRPWIDSRVASGPYLGVFVPFLPRRHLPAMRRTCPGLLAPEDLDAPGSALAPAPGSAAAAAARTAVDCLALLSDLRVDGVPPAATFAASSDSKTLQRGILAMVPVRGLAEGRHELSLALPGEIPNASPTQQRYRIAFWK